MYGPGAYLILPLMRTTGKQEVKKKRACVKNQDVLK